MTDIVLLLVWAVAVVWALYSLYDYRREDT